MLRKRDLPVCVPLPGIKFDIEKMKQEYKALDHMFRNLYEENKGITDAHNQEFLKDLNSNEFLEVALTGLDPSIDKTNINDYNHDYKSKHNKISHPDFD